MAAAGKLELPKMQNKWPGIDAVEKVLAFKPLNHNMETLKFYLKAKVIFAKVSFKNPTAKSRAKMEELARILPSVMSAIVLKTLWTAVCWNETKTGTTEERSYHVRYNCIDS